MTLTKILAKKDGYVFGKTTEGNVVFKEDSGDVVATGWFESFEDGWYLDSESDNKFEFFGGTAEEVVVQVACVATKLERAKRVTKLADELLDINWSKYAR
jgi:hypothetical protein